MTKTKSDINKKHYDKNSEVLRQKARTRYVETKKLKTFGELMQELSTATQKAKAKFIIENTPNELLRNETRRQQVALAFEQLMREEDLTESETLQIKKNKRLVQRWHMFLKALEQHMNATIDKRIKK